MAHSWSLELRVERCEPELITPSEPTPYGSKYLSDVDDQQFLRFRIPVVHIYRKNESMKTEDPVKVIKQAVAKTLVHYYPFAGRLREGDNGKLMVECTGEGVLFTEANANVKVDDFPDVILPPIPAIEEFLYDVPGSNGIINSPLLLIQVTRLMCGGFIFALRLNHTMADAAGLIQLLKAIGEMARGSPAPSVEPVWDRELLMARDPPRVTCMHKGYEDVPSGSTIRRGNNEMVHGLFFFGPAEMSILKNHVPSHLRNCSTFDLVTACLWRCRTIALGTDDPNDEVLMEITIDARNKLYPPLPAGYYGNAISLSPATARGSELMEKPLAYAVELVKKAKANVTDEYIRSLADYQVLKGRPTKNFLGSYIVSDLRHVGFGEIDFGWGKPVYGGPDIERSFGFSSYYLPLKNDNGENGLVATLSLPRPTEEKFVMELNKLTREPHASKGVWREKWPKFSSGKACVSKRNFTIASESFKYLDK